MAENDRDRLLDLIVKWDELRDRGEAASPEELCPDDPCHCRRHVSGLLNVCDSIH